MDRLDGGFFRCITIFGVLCLLFLSFFVLLSLCYLLSYRSWYYRILPRFILLSKHVQHASIKIMINFILYHLIRFIISTKFNLILKIWKIMHIIFNKLNVFILKTQTHFGRICSCVDWQLNMIFMSNI